MAAASGLRRSSRIAPWPGGHLATTPGEKITMSRRISAALAVAALTCTTAAVAATPASAAAPNVPTSCRAHWGASTSTGAYYWYTYANQRATATRVSTNRIGWRPTAEVQVGAYGDTGSFTNEQVATSQGGKLMTITRKGVERNGVWAVSQSTRTVKSSGWTGTRALATDGRYLYRLHGGYLTRYPISWTSTGSLKVGSATRIGSGYGNMRSIVYERSGTVSGKTIDVLLHNVSSGALRELRVPRSAPTQRTYATLRWTGFQNFRSLTTAPCGSKGRSIGGLTDGDRMYVYYDPTAADSRGTDIRGGWTGKGGFALQAYGQ